MPVKQNESLLDYRRRVIDPVSTSFCGAKWYNATIWLGSGTTASCHHPPAHNIDVNEIKENPKALHNTKHKKEMRQWMQTGKRPGECDYCWRIEDMGRDSISDRVFKSVMYTDEELDRAAKMPWDEDVNLITLEVAFDRTCQFACSYCNASFSTQWGKDIDRFGPYQNLVSDGARAFQQDGKWAQPYKTDDENPYIQAFWKWWPELQGTLKEFRITGGEPLMSPSVWKLFDYFEKNGSGDLLFSINSNLGARDELIDRLVEKSHHVNQFDLYTSCEAIGAQAEYIRDGLDFEKWKSNVEKVVTKGKVRSLNVMMTINSLCLYSMPEFLDEMVEMKRKWGKQFPYFSVNLLRFPSFMSPLALPDHLKEERRSALKAWLAQNRDNELINEGELAGVERLIDYLEVVKDPHKRTSSIDSRHRDFKSFHVQYDRRRSKNFRETFPKILVDWYDSIPETDLTQTNLVDGHVQGWILNPDDENPK